MLKRKAKILKTFLIMFLLITVNISIIRADVQKIKYNNLTHFNVGLVIDGSGSLGSTDPNKLRYDAIDLFLALLTNKGNNIDTVVFNDNKSGYAFHSGLMSVDGRVFGSRPPTAAPLAAPSYSADRDRKSVV